MNKDRATVIKESRGVKTRTIIIILGKNSEVSESVKVRVGEKDQLVMAMLMFLVLHPGGYIRQDCLR